MQDNAGAGATRTPRALFELGATLLTLGVLVVLFVAYDLWGTGIAERQSQAALAHQFRAEVAQAERSSTVTTAPPPRPRGVPAGTGAHPKSRHRAPTTAPARRVTVLLPPPGGALDHLVIPAIRVDRYVVQGVAEADLQMGPGHYPGTPLPGQPGNVGIAGHRTTFGAPFFELNALKAGDLIYVTDTSATTWVYRVQRQWVVAPTDVAVLAPTPGDKLTLTTCNPRFEATSRLVVRAALAGRLAPGTRFGAGLPARSGPPANPASVPPGSAPPTSVTTKPSGPATATTGAGPQVTATTGVGSHVTAGAAKSSPGGSSAAGNPTVALPASSGPVPVARPSGARPLETQATGGWSWAGTAGWAVLALAVWVTARTYGTRRRGWAKAGTVTAGALVALVPLWFVFENLVRLLPANY